MRGQAARYGRPSLSRAADVMAAALVEMRGTTSPRLVLELACARVLLPGAASDTAALLARLDRLERRLSATGVAGPGRRSRHAAATGRSPPTAGPLVATIAARPAGESRCRGRRLDASAFRATAVRAGGGGREPPRRPSQPAASGVCRGGVGRAPPVVGRVLEAVKQRSRIAHALMFSVADRVAADDRR